MKFFRKDFRLRVRVKPCFLFYIIGQNIMEKNSAEKFAVESLGLLFAFKLDYQLLFRVITENLSERRRDPAYSFG